MHLILVIALLALTGCTTLKDWFCKEDEPKKVVVEPSTSPGDLSKIGAKIDKSDSRIGAAVTVMVENKDKPSVVEAEGKVALGYLPKPDDGDIAVARARAAKADPKDYIAQSKFAKDFLEQLDKEWKDANTKAQKNATDLAAALTKINELNAELTKVRKDAEINLRKAEAEASKSVWTLAGAGLAVIGALCSAFMSPKIGVPLLLCGAFCGGVPFIINSPYFMWVAVGTAAVSAGLGLWWLWDKVRDSVNNDRHVDG